MFEQMRGLVIAAVLGCGCGSSTPPVYCPDAGKQYANQLCGQWASAATRLCLADSGVCGTANAFDCAASCNPILPLHCTGYAQYLCGQSGVDALNQILDAGTCGDLLPAAFGQATCDGYYNPEPY
jgi:hypothetical protein